MDKPQTFTLDGQEYALDGISPAARQMVELLMDLNNRYAPVRRDILIADLAQEQIITQLRKQLVADEAAADAKGATN